MSDKSRAVILVSGGIVQEVKATEPLQVDVVDMDNIEQGDEDNTALLDDPELKHVVY